MEKITDSQQADLLQEQEPTMLTKLVKKPSFGSGKFPKWLKITAIILLVLVAIFGSVGTLTYLQAKTVKSGLDMVVAHGQAAYTGLKGQDLVAAKTELEAAQSSLITASEGYAKMGWLKFSPFAWHYADGVAALEAASQGLEAGLILINAVEPYADVIGFQGQGSFTGGTAEDRIVKIIETVDKINPSLDEFSAKLDQINLNLQKINPRRYPYIKVAGRSVADGISQAQTQLSQTEAMLAQFQPAISVLPSLAGVDESKKYLIIFQNDAELRPTGGFLTAYAVLKVEKGKIIPEKSSDIYDLDDKFRNRPEPPAAIRTYLNERTWYLRNMNFSPDFAESMTKFAGYYSQIPGESDVDGIIAVDTQFLADLISVLGPVEVPGFGRFSSDNHPRCDCPQVIYALEEIADRPTYTIRTDRKAVLGPLMQTILTQAYGAPKQSWPGLFNALWTNMTQKHILMYFFNEDAQNAAEMVGVGGRMKEYDADYLHINDANFGGAKSNLFTTQNVEQDIVKEGDWYIKTITITYKNPRKADNCNLEAGQLCLNGKMPLFTRIYLPKDAQVVETLGFNDNTVLESEEFNKKVVEGYFELLPESQARIKLTVKVPVKGDAYRLLIQKQPGTKNYSYLIRYHDQEEEFELTADREVILN